MNKGGLWSKIASACGTDADCDFCEVKLENVPQNGYTDAIRDFLCKINPSYSMVSLTSVPVFADKVYEAYKEAEFEAKIEAERDPDLPHYFAGVNPFAVTYGTAEVEVSLSDCWQARHPEMNPETEYLLKSCRACIKQDIPFRFFFNWNPKTREYEVGEDYIANDYDFKNLEVTLTFIRQD